MPLELLFLMCHCLLADDIATLAEVKVNGFPCKASATADDFFSSILAKPGATNTTSGSVVTGANVEKVPGLNTLGVSLSRIDYAPGGLNQLCSSPLPGLNHSGYMPFLTIPAGLLGFFLSRMWTRLLDGCEVLQLPFTRQENTVIQTFVVACSNIAYSGGFGSYLLAMSRNAAEDGIAYGGAKNVDEPRIGRLVAFLFLTSFVGIFAIMPFRNSLVIRHYLTFPTGTATAHLINSMHTPHGAKQAR